jgi:hypothetical protein
MLHEKYRRGYEQKYQQQYLNFHEPSPCRDVGGARLNRAPPDLRKPAQSCAFAPLLSANSSSGDRMSWFLPTTAK